MSTTTLTLEKAPASTGKALGIALWAAQLYGAYVFLTAAFAKLSGAPQMIGLFEAIGLGQWFRFLTGGIELVAAILLLVPRLSGVGALLLIPTMAGAIITHLAVIGGSIAMPLGLLVAMGFVAYGRRERTLALIRR